MRQLSQAQVQALSSGHLLMAVLGVLHFDSGVFYLTDAPHDVEVGANTYRGLGHLIQLEVIKDSMAPQTQDLRATLSGVPLTYRALALSEPVRGRRIDIAVALIDTVSRRAIDNAITELVGRMDNMTIVRSSSPDGAEATASIELRIENTLQDWGRPPGGRFNDGDQLERFAGDRFFEYTAKISEQQLVWPSKEFFKV